MVTISNGIATYRVTLGAAKLYKSMGFHIVGEQDAPDVQDNEYQIPQESPDSNSVHDGGVVDAEQEPAEIAGNDDVGDDGFIEELLEKPLSMWSSEEMKSFVVAKGIDTSGAQKVSQVRAIIKAYLEEQKKSA